MKTDEGLIRAVGVRGLTAAIINYTIGAGIFVLPAVVAGKVGAAAPVIYIVCAIAMGLVVLCFADAGSRVSLSGGTYAYAETAFGPFAGFIVAITLWLGSAVLACAAVANVSADAFATLFPVLATPWLRGTFIALMFAGLAAINIRGVRIGSGVVQTFTVAKLTPLLILAIAGMFAINWNNLAWPGMPTGSEIARTTVLLIFAFTGVESALTPSGEVKNPARTVPRSILIALVSVTILYMILQVVAQGILGAELATNTKAPLAEAARRSIGDIGQKLVLIGMAISTFGYVAGDMLASPRSIYALGRDNLIPSVVGSVHEKYRTPHVAIVVHAIACAGFAISGSFASLAVLAVLSVLIVYLVCCLATIQLRRKNVRTEGALPFSVPGGPIIPLLAVAMLIWLMSSSTKQEFIAIGAMLAAEVVLYFIMRLRRVPVPVVS